MSKAKSRVLDGRAKAPCCGRKRDGYLSFSLPWSVSGSEYTYSFQHSYPQKRLRIFSVSGSESIDRTAYRRQSFSEAKPNFLRSGSTSF